MSDWQEGFLWGYVMAAILTPLIFMLLKGAVAGLPPTD